MDVIGRAITLAITKGRDIRKSFTINMVHGEGIEPSRPEDSPTFRFSY
jgi:hypothetical protein